jgi:DNA (cytosine-5)-methyltransferase 1
MLKSNIEAIDLFCGAGGLSCGLNAEGIRVKAGIDIDPYCEYPFTANHKGARFLLRDVTTLSGEEVSSHWSPNSIRLLAGCAPCQPFSSYANTRAAADNGKWGLLYEFARLVKATQPELVTMENVPRLVRELPFIEFLNVLESLKYKVAYGVLNAANFGAAQQRRRLVLVASRLGDVKLPEETHPGPKHWITVRKIIGKLPILKAGETAPHDPLHVASELSPLNLRRIKASRAGGTWRDWPDELVADCHKKESGKHSAGVYGRMEWDKPAPTMTTLCNGYGNGRFGHPEQDRAITLREAAIFQSFPPQYKFVKKGASVKIRPIARLIGNAVPPKLGEAVARSLRLAVPA